MFTMNALEQKRHLDAMLANLALEEGDEKAPSNCGFDPIRPRNVIANCVTEFSRVWAYNPSFKPESILLREKSRSDYLSR